MLFCKRQLQNIIVSIYVVHLCQVRWIQGLFGSNTTGYIQFGIFSQVGNCILSPRVYTIIDIPPIIVTTCVISITDNNDNNDSDVSSVTDIPPPGDHVCHPNHQPHQPQLQHLHGFHQDRVQSRRPPLPDHGHHRDNIHPRHNPQGKKEEKLCVIKYAFC